ncbi:hypothetical protein ACWDVX_37230 [Streptomyces tendae]
MSGTVHYNGQIPTDPAAVLLILLAAVYAAGHLTPDQTAALTATGGLAELVLSLLHLTRGNR